MRFLSAHLRLAAIVICLLIPSSLIASGFPKPLPKFPVGPLPAGVAVGDFNGDGKLDLVLVNQDHFTITAVLGRGDGTFRSPITSTGTCVAAAAGPVLVGDFNRDHKLDIAFSGDNGFCVSLGNGNGTFGSTVSHPDPGYDPIAVGDFNGDGKPDVLLSNSDVFLGNGDGTFRLLTSTQFFFVCSVADINGDGKLDLVGFDATELGTGDATFRAPVSIPNTRGICPAVADFNGDGKLDLAIPSQNGVSLLFGNGNGTFQAPATNQLGIDMSTLGSGSLLAADFNGDGNPDLFVKQTQIVGTILLNGGNGRFSYGGAASYPFPGLSDFFLGDFNADGRTDVVSVGFRGGSQFFASIALAGPHGTLPLPRAYFIRADDGLTLSLAAGDFNSDGKLDLAAVTNSVFFNTGELNVLLARRSGIFPPPLSSVTGDGGTNFVAKLR